MSKRSLMFTAVCLLTMSAGNVMAQCNRGSSGNMPTGSPTALTQLSSTTSGYSSSPLSMGDQYQHRVAQMQYSAYAQAKAFALDQAAQRAAYNDSVRPYRLARAEAKRKASADRIASRLADREGKSNDSENTTYSLTFNDSK